MTIEIVSLRRTAESILVTEENAAEVAKYVGGRLAVLIPNIDNPKKSIIVEPGQCVVIRGKDGLMYRAEVDKLMKAYRVDRGRVIKVTGQGIGNPITASTYEDEPF